MLSLASSSVTGRFLANNVIEKLDDQTNYKLHKKRLSDIRSSFSLGKFNDTQHLKIQHSLEKFKDIARSRERQKEEDTRRKQNVRIMLNLKGIYESKSDIFTSRQTSLVSKRKKSNKKVDHKILEQNLHLCHQISQIHRSPNQMKTDINKKIKQYLGQRARLRHVILPLQQKSHHKQLSYSRHKKSKSVKPVKYYQQQHNISPNS